MESDCKACHDYGDHAHELDKDIERRAAGVLEGIAHGVAYDRCVMALGVLASEMALLDVFLGVVPGSAGVGHEHGQNEACAEAADEKAEHTGDAEHYAHEYRHYYGQKGRAEHLVLGGLGGDLHAALVVGRAFAGEYALDFAELATDLNHHLGGGAAHGVHRESAEQEGHHGSDEYACENGGVHQGNVVVVEDVEYAGVGRGYPLPCHGNYLFAGAFEGYLDFFDVGGQQGECRERGAAYREALAGCRRGVAEGVEHVGAFADFRIEFAHLCVAARVVGYWAVSVGGEGYAEGAEHADSSYRDAVKALGEAGGGHHVGDIEADREEVCQHDGDDYRYYRNRRGNHTQADSVDDDGGRACLGSLGKFLGGLIRVRSIVFGGLSDDDACKQTRDHGAAEMPPVRRSRAENEGEYAEGGDSGEDGGHVGAEAHALQELAHAGAFLCADGEDADYGQHHAHCRYQHRGQDGPCLHRRAHGVEGRSAERHGGKDGSAVAFVKVGSHAGHVAHVVTHVVGDGGGIAGVVFRKVALDLAHYVRSHVGRFGVDAAAHAGEEGLGAGAHSEGEHGGGDDHELLGFGRFDHEDVEQDVPQGYVKQAEAHYGETHYRTAAEGYLEARVERAPGGVGRAAGREGGRAHAYIARETGEETTGEECEGHPLVLDVEYVCEHGEEHREHGEHDDDDLVLLPEICHGALTDVLGDLFHGGSPFVFPAHLAVENVREHQRYERRGGDCIE